MSLPKSPVTQFFTMKSIILWILSLSVFSSGMILIYTRHQSCALHVMLQKIQKQKDALHIEWTRLLLEQSTWSSDIRIEKIARENLNMVLPVAHQMRVIKP